MKKLGALIREARVKKGITMQTLADKLGVVQPYIVKIEKYNSPPSLQKIKKIEKILGVSLMECYMREKYPEAFSYMRISRSKQTLQGLKKAKLRGQRLGRPFGGKDREPRKKDGYFNRYNKGSC